MTLSVRVCSMIGTTLLLSGVANGFLSNTAPSRITRVDQARPSVRRTRLRLSDDKPEYSTEVRLREEVESPFRKVRFFVYFSLAGGAATSLAVSAARIAAALAGVNEDLLQESVVNAAVDLGGLVLIAFLYKRDVDAQDSRLKRATKGAELAKLKIRGSKSIIGDDEDRSSTFTTSLSSLRRGRGIEKRVVIAAAGKEKMEEILKEASALQGPLTLNDLLVVPVVLPQATAPSIKGEVPECVAIPVGEGWKSIVNDEIREAVKQGVDVEAEGISIVLKKNGKVGQRTKGVFLGNLIGEVAARRESGMDVSNI